MADEMGTMRRATPEEIGKVVRIIREGMDMKQITLAHEARISERAVQRVERGERVSDDTLVAIAKALQLEPEALTRPDRHYSDEEVKRLASKFKMIEAKRLLTLRDCDDLIRVHGSIPDTSWVGEEGVEPVLAFLDMVRDWTDIIDELSYSEAYNAKRAIFDSAIDVLASGYDIVYATYTSDDRFRVLVLTFFSQKNAQQSNVKQLLVPRLFMPGLKVPEAC